MVLILVIITTHGADNDSDHLIVVGYLCVTLKGKRKGESNKGKIESFDILLMNFKNFH